MASVEETPRSPVIANIAVILGFVAVFASFAVDSPVPWLLGVITIVTGGIWAGFSLTSVAGDDEGLTSPGGQSDGGAH